MSRIDIIGAGAFGTALAIAYGNVGHAVTLWARDGAGAAQASRQTARLPAAMLPETVTVTGDLADLSADIALLALPTQAIGPFLSSNSLSSTHLVSCAKGIDRATGLGPAALIARHSRATPLQLTGPSFAADIAAGLPTALTLACADDAIGEALQTLLSTPTLRLYRTTDVAGAELGGALKNVIAIAAGAVIGGGLGDSARAALIARGFAEMRRLARDVGAREETLAGLSGLGDLILTCTSPQSRNFRFGVALAKGEPFDTRITVEGLHTARQIADSALDTPIAAAVAALADGRLDFAGALDTLLSRPLRQE